ncbi:hypothetical protein [Geminicoccus flavidas]|uniref:hypothetical protein n=1 Tax=Geminicoccus flavidas TaxID=2506407 RepID=UPI0013582FFA|nr:hypothetical protein [Geminicoccus flavidas]
MDLYSKAMLTVIAAGVAVLAYKSVVLDPPRATVGEWVRVGAMPNGPAKQQAVRSLQMSIPVVQVHGGSINAY